MMTFGRFGAFRAPRRQQGAVLFVALAFLILLTLLALASSGNALLQERMTGGVRNRQLALFGAESALRFGESQIYTAPTAATFDQGGVVFPTCVGDSPRQPCVWDQIGVAIHYQKREPVRLFRTERGWPTTGTQTYVPQVSSLSGASETASITAQPLLLYEDLGIDKGGPGDGQMGGAIAQEVGTSDSASRRVYRVTARSMGGNGDAAVRVAEIVYSTYSVDGNYAAGTPTP